jgi:hypothetical protein
MNFIDSLLVRHLSHQFHTNCAIESVGKIIPNELINNRTLSKTRISCRNKQTYKPDEFGVSVRDPAKSGSGNRSSRFPD